MNNKVFVSCAVTGSGDTASKHPDLPKTPKQIGRQTPPPPFPHPFSPSQVCFFKQALR